MHQGRNLHNQVPILSTKKAELVFTSSATTKLLNTDILELGFWFQGYWFFSRNQQP